MSLKHFHIFFVILSVVICFGFGYWGIHGFVDHDGTTANLIWGIIAVIAGSALIVYGIQVYQKLKEL